MLSRTLLLDPTNDRDALHRDIGIALEAASTALHLHFAHDGTEREGDTTFTVWTDDPEGSSDTSWLRLTDDPGTKGLWLELHAVDEAQLRGLEDAIATRIGALTRAQIDDAVRADPTRIAWIGLEGNGRPFDPGATALLEAGLVSADEDTRKNAQLAVAMLRWKALVPAVEAALAGATSVDHRRALEAILGDSKSWSA